MLLPFDIFISAIMLTTGIWNLEMFVDGLFEVVSTRLLLPFKFHRKLMIFLNIYQCITIAHLPKP